MDVQTVRELLEFTRQFLESDTMVANAIKILIVAIFAIRRLEPIILQVISIVFRR